MRELKSDEIDLIAGGLPGSPGILSGNVVRLFTEVANSRLTDAGNSRLFNAHTPPGLSLSATVCVQK